MNSTLLIDILAGASGVLLIGGFIPYIREVVKRKTIPNKFSWFIWALSTTILLFSVLNTGTTEAIWLPIADAVGCIIIFLLSLYYGEKGWNLADIVSLTVCIGSLIVWGVTGNAFIALVMNLFVYVSGYMPTIVKVFHKPKSESRLAWLFFLSGTALNLAVVILGTDTGLAVWLYPITLFVCVGTLYIFLYRKTR